MTKWDSSFYREALILRNKELMASAGKAFLLAAPACERKDVHLIVKRNEHVVGTAILHPVSKSYVQVKQVAVSSRCQGEGLGKELLIYAEQVARGLGFRYVFLTGRKQAWGFYEKLGYLALSEEYQEGHLAMKVYKKDLRLPLEQVEKREMKTNG